MRYLRTILLWVVLVLLFLFFYQMFNRPDGAAHARETAPSEFAFYLPLVFLGLFAIFFVYFLARARKGAAMANSGVVLVNQGRLNEGLAKIEASRPYLRNSPQVSYLAGSVKLSLWQLSQAETELRKALKTTLSMNARHVAVPKLALTTALLGREDATRGFLADAEKLNITASPDSLVATVVLDCRAARWENAAQTLARNELRNLGGPTRGLADALRAWCSEQLTGQAQPFDLVAVLGEASIEGVRASWPELASFLERAPRSAP